MYFETVEGRPTCVGITVLETSPTLFCLVLCYSYIVVHSF